MLNSASGVTFPSPMLPPIIKIYSQFFKISSFKNSISAKSVSGDVITTIFVLHNKIYGITV